MRVAFELDPQASDVADLRLDLLRDGRAAGEVWVYRWTE